MFCVKRKTARTNLLSWINQGSLAGVVQFLNFTVGQALCVQWAVVYLSYCITASLSDRPAVKLGSGLPPSSKI